MRSSLDQQEKRIPSKSRPPRRMPKKEEAQKEKEGIEGTREGNQNVLLHEDQKRRKTPGGQGNGAAALIADRKREEKERGRIFHFKKRWQEGGSKAESAPFLKIKTKVKIDIRGRVGERAKKKETKRGGKKMGGGDDVGFGGIREKRSKKKKENGGGWRNKRKFRERRNVYCEREGTRKRFIGRQGGRAERG